MHSNVVSIIVPVYKAEKYIQHCIDDLLAQTYTNLEIILVDDGSPDNSGAICEEYAQKDQRIMLVRQENQGVSAARNAAMALATGVWICFVDADDRVAPRYVEQLMDARADWTIGGYRTSAGHECALPQMHYHGNAELSAFYQAHFQHLYANLVTGNLYKRSIICNNGLSFDTRIRFSEDFLFNLNYCLYCETVALKPEVCYTLTVHRQMEEKYGLTIAEIERTIESIRRAVGRLAQKWNVSLSCDRSVRINLSMYPLTRLLADSSEYEHLFAKYLLGTGSIGAHRMEYLQDYLCSPLHRGIRAVKAALRQGQPGKAISLMRKIRARYGDVIPAVRFTRFDKLVALLCRK